MQHAMILIITTDAILAFERMKEYTNVLSRIHHILREQRRHHTQTQRNMLYYRLPAGHVKHKTITPILIHAIGICWLKATLH